MIIDKTKELFERINKFIIKNQLYILKGVYILFALLALLGVVGFFVKQEILIIMPMLTIFLGAVIYCLKNIKDRIVLFFFLGCFFTFIMSQYVTVNTGIPLHRDTFPLDNRVHTTFCVFLSILSLVSANVVWECVQKKRKNSKCKHESYFLNNDKNKIKLISKISFYITALFALITLIERIIYSNQHGYLGYIADFETVLPFIVTYISGCFYVVFFLFISSIPNRKEMLLPNAIYVIYVSLTLLTGSRSTFVLGIINLVLALVVREYKVEKPERIITKKRIIILCAFLPVIIFGLNIYNTARNSVETNNKNFLQNINDFFANQGSALAIVCLEKQYHEELEIKRYPYVFYAIVKEVESIYNKELYYPIKDVAEIEEKIYKQNSLGQKISYYYHKDKIIEGYGLGSNYIAEAYADGGYVGVIIINILFGTLIFLFNKFLYKNWILSTVALITTLSFMYVPRDPTFNWLNSITSVNLWAIIGIIYIITKKNSIGMRES